MAGTMSVERILSDGSALASVTDGSPWPGREGLGGEGLVLSQSEYQEVELAPPMNM